MTFQKILIANRGEIAIRIARGGADLGVTSFGIYSEDDSKSLHCRMVDQPLALTGIGPAAYLDIDQVIRLANENRVDAIHPGYGLLSENAEFAERVLAAGIQFVGPQPTVLAAFGDKSRARSIADAAGIPILKGTQSPTSIDAASDFFHSLPPGSAMMIKASAGGGGRGSRILRNLDSIESVWERCRSEAKSAFGCDDLYVEELIESARHIEVQVVGDGTGQIIQVGERDCTVQRRHQKLIEIAPAPFLEPSLRRQLHAAAVRLAEQVDYTSLGTVEFLVDTQNDRFAFIECNPRLQVEHTVTEELTGIDLVQTQLQIAAGASLADLGLTAPHRPQGFAIQCRVNMETLLADGTIRPTSGQITEFLPSSGPGVRIDAFGYAGYQTVTSFDSLLAKVISHSRNDDFPMAAKRAKRVLEEFRIQGLDTNQALLAAILDHPDFTDGSMTTRWVDQHASELAETIQRQLPVPPISETAEPSAGYAGAQINQLGINHRDPLAVFAYDQQQSLAVDKAEANPSEQPPIQGDLPIVAPIQGTIIAVEVSAGDQVRAGATLIVMEAMKMEHTITAPVDGTVSAISVGVGDTLVQGHTLAYLNESETSQSSTSGKAKIDLDHIRDDLQESIDRHAYGLDENRPEAVEKRLHRGQRTARANIADLCDDGSFQEYGSLVVAAQRRRRSLEWLRERTPADGVVMGIGHINGDQFPDIDSRAVVVAYDYTVLAGTQGLKNHYKQDRMFHLAERFRLPVVIYTEGGGGRPGDTDTGGGIGMDVETFTQWSKLSGLVPLVGINSGYCFAGNTALLGCCDVIIATKDSTIGMGGPAMIEGGGLGIFAPREIGPMTTQVPNGVVDIVADDEAHATAIAKQYLSYFQGDLKSGEAHDQRPLRHVVPENRKRIYDMREAINTIADVDSVLEIRRAFGVGIITALARVEGRPIGIIANNPYHLAGAIDSDGADKAARFLQLCDAYDLPILSLMDCPGIMVGPEVEKTALVRHACRMFNTGANLSVPMFGLIMRKAYGLGIQAMCGGSSMVPLFMAAWPTAEFAPMNIEGAIKLGYRNELAAIEDPVERAEEFEAKVAAAYEEAKAVNAAEFFGIDDVIDPAESRSWIVAGLRSLPAKEPRFAKKRPYIDTW